MGDRVAVSGPAPFVEALAAQAGPTLRRLAGDGLAAGLAAFVADPWGWLADDDFAARFHAACPAPGTTAADYRTRRLAAPGGTLLAGIRFRGGDLGFPFVEVLADHAVSPAIAPIVAAAFAPFRPRAMRAWRLGPAGPDFAAWPGANQDAAYWAGRASELRARPRPARFEDLAVVPVTDQACRPQLEAAYAAFHAACPALARDVTLEDAATLGRAQAAGLLLEARVGGEWAGVIAAAPESHLGLTGWLVVEEILAAPFRGRGLGPALQRHLLERLPGDGVLFGTIHRDNAPSARTAAALGREVVAESWWLRL